MPFLGTRFTISSLLHTLKNKDEEIKKLKSGEYIQKIKNEFLKLLKAKDREIEKLKEEIARLHAALVDQRNKWMQVNEDVVAQAEAQLAAKDQELKRMQDRMFEAQHQRDEARDECTKQKKEKYEALARVQDLEDEKQKLIAQLHKDYTNSSMPSSASPNHPKITNGREKTNRKPGAQPGHPHHGRASHTPTETVNVPPPPEYFGSGYQPTGKMIRRQVIDILVIPKVTEFVTPEFICLATGKTVHADFPEGVKDDVNYGGTVKAFGYLLNNKCNVSIAQTKAFMSDISNGEINLSTGFICGLSKEFSQKTQAERDQIFRDLVRSPVMHTDFTFGRVNGKQGTVLVNCTGNLVLYQGKEKKGFEGIKNSPVENYFGILISDHESTFVDLAKGGHQECLCHVLRYLKSSIENEPDREWNTQMQEWVRKAIHYWNVANAEDNWNEEETAALIEEFSKIIEKGKSEYEYVPPNDYYRDGYNLWKRMSEDPEDYLTFLRNPLVDPQNNQAEVFARKCKRKFAQVMCFRSQRGLEYYCDGLSVIESLKARCVNLFEGIAEMFNRAPPPTSHSRELAGTPSGTG